MGLVAFERLIECKCGLEQGAKVADALSFVLCRVSNVQVGFWHTGPGSYWTVSRLGDLDSDAGRGPVSITLSHRLSEEEQATIDDFALMVGDKPAVTDALSVDDVQALVVGLADVLGTGYTVSITLRGSDFAVGFERTD